MHRFISVPKHMLGKMNVWFQLCRWWCEEFDQMSCSVSNTWCSNFDKPKMKISCRCLQDKDCIAFMFIGASQHCCIIYVTDPGSPGSFAQNIRDGKHFYLKKGEIETQEIWKTQSTLSLFQPPKLSAHTESQYSSCFPFCVQELGQIFCL